jgi:hypothetical protein
MAAESTLYNRDQSRGAFELMSDNEGEEPINRRALAILAPLVFVAYLVKAIALGGGTVDIIIAVSVVTLIYGTLIGMDLYKKR